MKKIVSILLCTALILSLVTVAFAAEEKCPVIFVPGYTASRMYINRGTDGEKRVWKVDVADELIDALKKEIPKLLLQAGGAVVGNYDALFKTLEPYANEITDYLRINSDGTSKYDVEVYPHAVEDTRLDALQKIKYYPDYDTLNLLKQYESPENIYCCTLDWRLGQIDNAAILNAYVDDVLAATGAEKVNLIGVSYGGQVTASYLSLYGGDKVNKTVLHCPALDGSSIVPQLLGDGDITLAWSDALKLVQTFRGEEVDFSEITDVVNPDCLNGFIKEFIIYYLYDLFLNFGSAWDLVPLAQYPALRDKLLNDGQHSAIIAKSDKYHFEVAAHLKENLQRLQREGVQISIIAGYGYKLVTDNGMTSDTVIEVPSATGAATAPVGTTLGSSYTPVSCGNASHCHLSPDCTVDGAAGYLPENTWYVEGMFHGLGVNEKDVGDLIGDLLFTDTVFDVHASTKYPQFMSSDNPFIGVQIRFTDCAQGWMVPYSAELTVTNLSEEGSIALDNINARGASLTFCYSTAAIAPGESATVKVYGTLPADLTPFSVTVDYVAVKENYRVAKSRTQYFRYTDGSQYEDVLFDGIGPDAPTVCEGEGKRSGSVNILNYFARFFYNLRKFLSKIVY